MFAAPAADFLLAARLNPSFRALSLVRPNVELEAVYNPALLDRLPPSPPPTLSPTARPTVCPLLRGFGLDCPTPSQPPPVSPRGPTTAGCARR